MADVPGAAGGRNGQAAPASAPMPDEQVLPSGPAFACRGDAFYDELVRTLESECRTCGSKQHLDALRLGVCTTCTESSWTNREQRDRWSTVATLAFCLALPLMVVGVRVACGGHQTYAYETSLDYGAGARASAAYASRLPPQTPAGSAVATDASGETHRDGDGSIYLVERTTLGRSGEVQRMVVVAWSIFAARRIARAHSGTEGEQAWMDWNRSTIHFLGAASARTKTGLIARELR